MHIKDKYAWMKHLDFMAIDFLSLIVSFLCAYLINFGSLNFMSLSIWRTFIVIIAVLDVLYNVLTNPYSGIMRKPYYDHIFPSLKLMLYNLVTVAVILYGFKIGPRISRTVLFVTYILYFALSLLLKYVWKKLLVSGKVHMRISRCKNLFIVGESDTVANVAKNATAGDFKLYEIVGVYLPDGGACGELPCITEDYIGYILHHQVDEVLFALPPARISPEDYRRLIDNDVAVHLSVDAMIGMQSENQFVSSIGVNRTLTVGTYSFTPKQLVYFGVKRVFDFIIGLIGCVLLIPLSLGVKIAYLCSGDRAPIFYTHMRVGKNGRPIRLFKFRSMVPNADEVLRDMLKDEKYRTEWAQNQKFEDDPRITKLGRWLRRTSLDETPQFINMLIGNMSLVGPRPLVEGELELHNGLKLYQRVKPGITGWWGCNGRSNIDYRERLDMEYYYVKNCSIYLDVLCVFRTVAGVLKREGAK